MPGAASRTGAESTPAHLPVNAVGSVPENNGTIPDAEPFLPAGSTQAENWPAKSAGWIDFTVKACGLSGHSQHDQHDTTDQQRQPDRNT